MEKIDHRCLSEMGNEFTSTPSLNQRSSSAIGTSFPLICRFFIRPSSPNVQSLRAGSVSVHAGSILTWSIHLQSVAAVPLLAAVGLRVEPFVEELRGTHPMLSRALMQPLRV